MKNTISAPYTVEFGTYRALLIELQRISVKVLFHKNSVVSAHDSNQKNSTNSNNDFGIEIFLKSIF